MEEECTYFPKIFECIAYHVGVVQIPPVQNKTIQNASQQLNIRIEGYNSRVPYNLQKAATTQKYQSLSYEWWQTTHISISSVMAKLALIHQIWSLSPQAGK